jgi:DNA gyrase subunit B
MVKQYNTTYAMIKRLERLYPSEILEAMVFTRPLTEAEFTEPAIKAWISDLSEQLHRLNPKTALAYEMLPYEDPERHVFLPEVRHHLHGLSRGFQFSKDFFGSGEYRALNRLGEMLDGLIETGAYVKRGEKTQEIQSFREGLRWLTDDAMKGHYLQRYKGLGEMNPGQLWETTMDPENRRMLQVTIEDAIGADQLFTTLMGDQVEPRREFIESNALAVQNLDI